MPFVHDTLTELIERHPHVLRQLCVWGGARVPDAHAELESHRNELRLSIGPTDSRLLKPDLYLLERGDVGYPPSVVTLVEIQASPNARKPLTWDIYHLLVLLFHEVDPELLLVALGAAMEATCRDLSSRVRVADIRLVGPSMIPRSVPADVHVAAAMVAILKEQTPRDLATHALRGLLHSLPDPRSADYYWMVLSCLPKPLREELMMSMKHESYFTEEERELDIYKRASTEGEEKGREEGREEGLEKGRQGLIQAVLNSLHSRGLEPSDELKIALDGIHDQDRLVAIVGRAAVVESAAALLDEIQTDP